MVDQAHQLRLEYSRQQKRLMRRARALQVRRRLAGLLGGASVGALTVLVPILFYGGEITWRGVWPDLTVCGVAGYLLVRLRGGLLKGSLLLSLGYLGAHAVHSRLLEARTLATVSDMGGAMAGHGMLISLCAAIVGGGALGHLLER